MTAATMEARSKKKPKRPGRRRGNVPFVGPYGERYVDPDTGRAGSRLTAEGRELLAGIMAKHPHPISFLKTAWPRLHRACELDGVPDDEVDAACMEGMVRGLVRYDPSRAGVTTALAWSIRGTVADLLRVRARFGREFANSHNWDGGDGVINREPAARESEPEPDRRADPAALIAAAALTARERVVIALRFEKGLTFARAGEALGVSKERVRQLEEAAVAKLQRAAGLTPPRQVTHAGTVAAVLALVRRAGRNGLTCRAMMRALGTSLRDTRAAVAELRASGRVLFARHNVRRDDASGSVRKTTEIRYRLAAGKAVPA
ncbi:---NA--- : : Sigma70_r4 [Gemmataceae bacterium]|nr:---NA--- : : Sigma70_r4 [Gemmataceae bacterium]VTT98906.1 ---NA--- : : Sigma70_r4 [Gemmataceae bacterium]